MDVAICDARSAHLPQLEALECACFSTPWTRAQLASQLPDDRHVFLIAAAGETVLGYANFLHVLDEGDIGNVARRARSTGGRGSRMRCSRRCVRARRRSISHF